MRISGTELNAAFLLRGGHNQAFNHHIEQFSATA